MIIDNEKEMLEFFEEEECMNEDLKKGINWFLTRKGWLWCDTSISKGSCVSFPNMIRLCTKFCIYPQDWEMNISYDLDNKTWNLDVDICGVMCRLENGHYQKGLEMRGYKDFDSFLKDFQPKLMRWYRARKKEIEKQ